MKKNGRGISELLSQSPGCIILPVLKGDHALRWWTGAIPLSQLGQRYKETAMGRCSPAPVWEDFLMCSPCPSCPLLSFRVLFCLFSPLPLVLSPLYYLFFLISIFLLSFLTQLYTYYFYSPSCCLCFPLPALYQLSKGQSGLRALSTAVLCCWLHLLTLLLLSVYTVGTSLGKQGEQGWLIEAKRSSIALRTAVCGTGLSS